MNNVKKPAVRLFAASLVLALFLIAIAGCGEESAPQYGTGEPGGTQRMPEPGPVLSDMGRAGEELFNANCSICHGVNAAGTSVGPTLIDRIYYPGHHPDFSIRNAVSNGVAQHHWVFGDMPPVGGLSSEDVENIICYVRETQRAQGIFEGDDFPTVC